MREDTIIAMRTEELLAHLTAAWDALGAVPWWAVAAPLVVLQLGAVLLIRRLRQDRKPEAGRWARRVQILSTTLGLVWSAQGMYSAAIDRYDMSRVMAAVAFTVFEAMLVNRMIKASQYRGGDRRVRDRHVRWVWFFGVAMALVVAMAEGWEQAPARLAIPLMVVAGWYLDLTGDDDPDQVIETQWRWTPRELGLALRLLKRSDRDRKTVSQAEREDLLKRITALARKDRISPDWLNTALRRRERLAALLSDPAADPELIAEARVIVARAVAVHKAGLVNPEATVERLKAERIPQRQIEVPPARRPRPAAEGSVYRRASDGEPVDDLRTEAIRLHRVSQAEGVRNGLGMTATELMSCFVPPMNQDAAERAATRARKEGPLRINGNVPEKL